MKRIKRKRINTGGKAVKGLPFMGEVMICAICKRQQKSDPKVESGWTLIQMDDVKKYVCPSCFGNHDEREC